jgi:hypothetical protein
VVIVVVSWFGRFEVSALRPAGTTCFGRVSAVTSSR